jgi:hypothetical protein
MSDRPRGSVRTEAPAVDGAPAAQPPAGTPAPGAAQPASATQSIPTGGVRAQGPATPDTSPGPGGLAAAPPGVPVGSGRPPGQPGATAAGAAAASRTGVRPARGKGGKSGRGPRRARLQLRHIDTWSAFKISLVLSIALFFIWMVAIGILYAVLSALGVFNTLNDLFGQLGSASGSKSGASNVITPGIVLGGAAVIGAINIILMTALCTVATFIYNMCADLVGGLEVTLSERD